MESVALVLNRDFWGSGSVGGFDVSLRLILLLERVSLSFVY